VIRAGSLEFALARAHARLSRRPAPAAWLGIERSRETGPVLELVRGTTLAPLAGPLAGAPDLHALDRVSRQAWRDLLADAARWMSAEWESAIAWCGILPFVPALAHLAGGGEVPAWLAQEPELASLAKAAPEDRRAALTAGALAPFARAWPDRSRLAAAWRDEWLRRVPHGELDETPLAELARLVAEHFARIADPSAPDSKRREEAFEAVLVRRLRRHPLEPAAVFAWLALGALDIGRLRGEMARRIALPLARPVP
jgi:hypothetical protein